MAQWITKVQNRHLAIIYLVATCSICACAFECKGLNIRVRYVSWARKTAYSNDLRLRIVYQTATRENRAKLSIDNIVLYYLSLVPRLLHRKTGDVACVVLCVVLIIELLPRSLTRNIAQHCIVVAGVLVQWMLLVTYRSTVSLFMS